jgi:cell division septation protein DedD
MNLKSVAMATGLVLTFAAGAWLSTIMLTPPQRPNRMTVQEQPPVPSPQPPMTRLPQSLPERLPDTAASDSILPPLPPLPPTPVATPPAPTPVAEAPVPKAPAPEPPPPADQAAAPPPEPPPPATAESPPTIVDAPPEPQPAPVIEAAPEPLAPAIPLVPVVETTPEADIDPGIAALSDLVTRAPSSPSVPPPSSPPHRAAAPDPLQFAPPPSPSKAASPAPVPPAPVPAASSAAQPVGPYFTIQVGSFQDPANAASLVRSLGVKGWEAFVVDWANGTGQIWKVVRVGRYQTEAQAVSASAELTSAANLRGNVIKVR